MSADDYGTRYREACARQIMPRDPSPAPDYDDGRLQGIRDGAAAERATILGPNATEADARDLAERLRRVHDGTDRGGLLALLQRLWGVAHKKPCEHVVAYHSATHNADYCKECGVRVRGSAGPERLKTHVPDNL